MYRSSNSTILYDELGVDGTNEVFYLSGGYSSIDKRDVIVKANRTSISLNYASQDGTDHTNNCIIRVWYR